MNDQKMTKNKEKKAQVVAEFAEKAQKAKAMVFTNYQGMTHKQLENLKKAIKKLDAELVVTKNRLLKRALEKVEDSTSSTQSTSSTFNFELPTATLFAYSDVIAPLKELAKVMKQLQLPKVKFGIFEGRTLSEDEVVKLSSLPSREILIAQFVGGLKSPIYGLHRALNWNLQKLVLALKSIEQKKSSAS